MGKRGGSNQNKHAMKLEGIKKRGNYWQNSQLNQRWISFYINMISQMAMSRFRWLNLPATCNERFLELVLLYDGVATIAFPKDNEGMFVSTKAVIDGFWNVYDNPTKWRSFGNNGWNFEVDNTNGVLIFENNSRYPLLNGIELYARELAEIQITKRMNLMHQKVPYVITGPQEKKNDMIQTYKQIAGGEPAIIATDNFKTMDVNALNTQVPYIGEELAQAEANTWNRVYTMLGIENSLYKAERQTEDEIRANKAPSNLVFLASLNERREAARKINERFGQYLEAPIEIVWAQDNKSENYNYYSNVQTQIRMGE